jgi:O-antigen ligase
MQGATNAGRLTLGSRMLFAVAALAPLPFGSNLSTAIAFWCIVLGVCLILVSGSVRALGRGQLALAGLVAIVIAAYAFVLHEQLTEHPWLATPNRAWHEAGAALGTPLTPVVSIVRNQPWFELGRPLACILALACGFLVGVDRGRARQLVKVIAWSGAAYAVYGILAHLIFPGRLLWLEKRAYLDSVTGTFVNRNTAGAYFGSCAVVWSLLLWERARLAMPRGPLDWRAMVSRMLSTPPKRVVVAFLMLFLCLAAMFMTGSRGAVVVSLLALIVAFTAFFRRDLPRRTGVMTALAGGGGAAFLLLQVMGAGVNGRFDIQGLADEGRLDTYQATLRMIADHPWFGTGQGTFASAFPMYRSPNASMIGVWDLAHNTLLEIAADMGVPIATLVVVAWIVIFVVLVRGALIRRHGVLVPVAALAVALLAVLHSTIDFSLQIPGYAIVALSIIGAGVAQSFREQPDQKRAEVNDTRNAGIISSQTSLVSSGDLA